MNFKNKLTWLSTKGKSLLDVFKQGSFIVANSSICPWLSPAYTLPFMIPIVAGMAPLT